MSMMHLVSVAEEAGLILPGRPRNPYDAFSHGMAQFKVDYIEECGD